MSTGRSVDVDIAGQEVVTIEFDGIDPNPTDVLDVLKEGQCTVWIWTKVASEYWRRGYLSGAEQIAQTAIDTFKESGQTDSLPPLYSLLANIQLSYARKAPKLILQDANQDILTDMKTNFDYTSEASKHLNLSQRYLEFNEEALRRHPLAFLSRGIQYLAQSSYDEALRSFDTVLQTRPTNIIALIGKARVLYAQRRFKEALRLYQDVLRYKPDCKPDPRVGIGLCLWALDHKAKAKAAWQRSLEVNPGEWSAQLLLGLESINASKAEGISEEAKSQAFLAGTKMIERAFQANQKNASAANALCELFIRKGSYARAMKLAERTIQFADTKVMLIEGYLRAGRVAHAQGDFAQARKFYSAGLAKLGESAQRGKNIVASIGMAQMQMHYNEISAAIHTLDTLIQAPNPQRSVEATVMLASLRTLPQPGVSRTQEKAQARELFDRALKSIEIDGARHGPNKSSRNIISDLEMHLEIARLWQGESTDRVLKAYKEAMRISEASGDIDPRLINNIGVLEHLDGHFSEARKLYEKALTKTAGQKTSDFEAMSTSMLFNLARVYEDEGETGLAKDAYDKLLSRHPEYLDAKIREAMMLLSMKKAPEAHELLKQALTSHPSNLNLRAAYLYLLMDTIRIGDYKAFKEFVFNTFKDHDKHDIYSLCMAAWVHYLQARESRDSSSKGVEERRRHFRLAAEFYEKALSLDPSCAYAAQGLAIIIAEDALGNMYGALAPPTADEHIKRNKNLNEALDIFAKVRESINDGSVYLNMGHCYYARDEFDKAIESYETASAKFYHGQNVPALLCLCRSWYSKGTKDLSLPALNTALRYAQQAIHILPGDKVVMYNIAMIQQKTAEMFFTIAPAKRTLKDLQRVIDHATNAQKLFAALAADKSSALPYNRDIADQRRKYGDTMLRKADDQLASQRQHEAEQHARLEAARQKRQEEKARQEASERLRMEQLRSEAEKLAEARRIAREQAMEWTREARVESEEERERRPKKPKKEKPAKPDPASGDEVEPKKKRRGKLKKAASTEPGDESAPVFSDEEDVEKPAKKRTVKKRVIRDEDEEDAGGPRKKQFKSKEMLSDTDDEMS